MRKGVKPGTDIKLNFIYPSININVLFRESQKSLESLVKKNKKIDRL